MCKAPVFPTLLIGVSLFGLAGTAEASRVIYVDQDAIGPQTGMSWEHAFRELSVALPTAQAGDEIWVAEGTFKPTTGVSSADQGISFELPDQVALYGGFAGHETSPDQRDIEAHATVLTGDLQGDDTSSFGNYDDNSVHVVTAGSDISTWAIFDGFMVTAGSADGSPGSWPSSARCGGLLVDGASEMTVRNCTFVSNYADWRGGGLGFINGATGSVQDCLIVANRSQEDGGGMLLRSPISVSRCTFVDNWAAQDVGGAVYILGAGRPFLRDCRFDTNRSESQGGAVFVASANLIVIRSAFLQNSCAQDGGAIGVQSDSGVTAINCLFLGNSASGHGGALDTWGNNTGLPKLAVNCVFSGNTAQRGGGASARSSNLELVNCTFSANHANLAGGGIYVGAFSVPDVDNCVLWDNTDGGTGVEGAQIAIEGFVVISVDHSNVEGWTGGLGGIGNFAAQPHFVDPVGPDGQPGTSDDDLTLTGRSLCINRGDNSALPSDDHDLDGDGDLAEAVPLDCADRPRVSNRTVDLGAYETDRPVLNPSATTSSGIAFDAGPPR